MTSVNVPPIQFYDKENDEAIKRHNVDIRLQCFSFMSMADYLFRTFEFCCHGGLFLWRHQYFMNIKCFSNIQLP